MSNAAVARMVDELDPVLVQQVRCLAGELQEGDRLLSAEGHETCGPVHVEGLCRGRGVVTVLGGGFGPTSRLVALSESTICTVEREVE